MFNRGGITSHSTLEAPVDLGDTAAEP